jgi:hydroxymethylpyrimidine pyrophosphatase-like HAD family hydrolase
VEADDPLAAAHRDLMRLDWTVCDFTTLCESESIIMGCLVVPTVEESTFRPILSAYAAKAGIRFSWSSHAARPEIRMVNIVMKDVSKGAALRALCKHLRISESETIAIGDGSNDVSLLEAAGLAIAMQNGPPELLAAADYITADVDHSGFTQAMEKFLFNLK